MEVRLLLPVGSRADRSSGTGVLRMYGKSLLETGRVESITNGGRLHRRLETMNS